MLVVRAQGEPPGEVDVLLGAPGMSWGRLERVLGRLGKNWDRLEASWEVLGAFWGRSLRASRKCFEAVVVPKFDTRLTKIA